MAPICVKLVKNLFFPVKISLKVIVDGQAFPKRLVATCYEPDHSHGMIRIEIYSNCGVISGMYSDGPTLSKKILRELSKLGFQIIGIAFFLLS